MDDQYYCTSEYKIYILQPNEDSLTQKPLEIQSHILNNISVLHSNPKTQI